MTVSFPLKKVPYGQIAVRRDCTSHKIIIWLVIVIKILQCQVSTLYIVLRVSVLRKSIK